MMSSYCPSLGRSLAVARVWPAAAAAAAHRAASPRRASRTLARECDGLAGESCPWHILVHACEVQNESKSQSCGTSRTVSDPRPTCDWNQKWLCGFHVWAGASNLGMQFPVSKNPSGWLGSCEGPALASCVPKASDRLPLRFQIYGCAPATQMPSFLTANTCRPGLLPPEVILKGSLACVVMISHKSSPPVGLNTFSTSCLK